ncbi:MAG: hypothetical protein HRU37_06605 [Roseibacillus sp.]|nr:hypothetical protein [Roseibacillus sp.]
MVPDGEDAGGNQDFDDPDERCPVELKAAITRSGQVDFLDGEGAGAEAGAFR